MGRFSKGFGDKSKDSRDQTHFLFLSGVKMGYSWKKLFTAFGATLSFPLWTMRQWIKQWNSPQKDLRLEKLERELERELELLRRHFASKR
jgi:hypothetical protein